MSNAHSSSNADQFPCNCAPYSDCDIVVNSGSATIAQGILTIPGAAGDETFRYFDILAPVEQKCYAAAVAQISHYAPSAFTVGTCCGESATYELKLISNQCDGDPLRSDYSITFDTDVTVAEIVDAFVAVINGDDAAFVTATDGTTHLVLTADTAGCAFITTFASDNFIVTTPTANVQAWGTPAMLEAQGIDTDYITADSYHSVNIVHREAIDDYDQCSTCQRICKKVCTIWYANDGSGDSFISSLNTITTGADTASKYLSVSGTITGC